MENSDTYLGHDVKYWLELEKKAEELGAVNFLDEIASLRGKIDFYESRLRQMNEIMNKNTF